MSGKSGSYGTRTGFDSRHLHASTNHPSPGTVQMDGLTKRAIVGRICLTVVTVAAIVGLTLGEIFGKGGGCQ